MQMATQCETAAEYLGLDPADPSRFMLVVGPKDPTAEERDAMEAKLTQLAEDLASGGTAGWAFHPG